MERPWAFAAALSWFLVAFVCLLSAVLSFILIITFQAGLTIGLLGVIIPFVVGRGIIGRSEAAGYLGTFYAVAFLAYLVSDRTNPSATVLGLVWLAIATAAATLEMRRSRLGA